MASVKGVKVVAGLGGVWRAAVGSTAGGARSRVARYAGYSRVAGYAGYSRVRTDEEDDDEGDDIAKHNAEDEDVKLKRRGR